MGRCDTMNEAPARVTPKPLTQEIVPPMPRYSSTPERFFAKVEFTDSCWLWTAGKTTAGYGQISIGGKLVYAHRYSYEFCIGPIPDGLTLDHLCRVRCCILPDHLEPTTHRENILRGEGLTAQQSRQTCCVHGHEFTEANTYRAPGAPRKRACRACRKMRLANLSGL